MKIKRFDELNENNSQFLINGSELFFFKSDLDESTKLKIVEWYNKLPEDERNYVDILRRESSDEQYFNSNGD